MLSEKTLEHDWITMVEDPLKKKAGKRRTVYEAGYRTLDNDDYFIISDLGNMLVIDSKGQITCRNATQNTSSSAPAIWHFKWSLQFIDPDGMLEVKVATVLTSVCLQCIELSTCHRILANPWPIVSMGK